VGDRVPAAMQTPEGHYAALPHIHATDGAFAARLVRR
jgi:16S rRNA C967 or C1407 C5-methylase (RsmB/RsmF family)